MCIYERYRRYLLDAKISHGGKGKGPRLHDLRHTFAVHALQKWIENDENIYAMHLLQAGVNLIYIRDLLGHADVSTTEIYARADEKMKLEALKKAYENPTNEDLPSWKKDNDLLDWLKSL